MKYYLIKIIFCICIVFFKSACHTLEHQNVIINNNIDKNPNKVSLDNENRNSRFKIKNTLKNNEMAPITIPKQKESVKRLALQKKVKIPKANKFGLDKFLNWNEKKLVKKLGKSHFIKEEGKLKNYQYQFKECFIDVFLLKTNDVYKVNYVEKRPTKLNGTIDINACFEEINQILN